MEVAVLCWRCWSALFCDELTPPRDGLLLANIFCSTGATCCGSPFCSGMAAAPRFQPEEPSVLGKTISVCGRGTSTIGAGDAGTLAGTFSSTADSEADFILALAMFNERLLLAALLDLLKAGKNIAASIAMMATVASAGTSAGSFSRFSQNNSFGAGRGVLKCASSFFRRSAESFSAASGDAGLTETSRTRPVARLSWSCNFASPASCVMAQRSSRASSSGSSPSSSAVSRDSISSRVGCSGFMT